MGMTLNKQVTTINGVTIENGYYIRLVAKLLWTGKTVVVELMEYPSKAAFLAGVEPLKNTFQAAQVFDYNRTADGADILAFAHNKVSALLANYGYTAEVITFDPFE